MTLHCPACDMEREVEFISRYKNISKTFDNKNLYQCRHCKLIFVHIMPTSKELEFYYKNIWLKDESIYSTSKLSELTHKIQADERVKYIFSNIDNRKEMKVLDVGSGDGYLYDAFKKIGADHIDFYATDPNPGNLERMKSRGINAFVDLDEIKVRNFDLVAVCFVLEHISTPLKFMQSLMEYVKEGGYIFIDLPERDDTFKPILEPHVAVYNIESLTKLVENLGLNIVHMTGYGRERSKLITELKEKKNITNTIISGISNKINLLIPWNNTSDKKIRKLYKYYMFDEEGCDRWWIRAIIRKSDKKQIYSQK